MNRWLAYTIAVALGVGAFWASRAFFSISVVRMERDRSIAVEPSRGATEEPVSAKHTAEHAGMKQKNSTKTPASPLRFRGKSPELSRQEQAALAFPKQMRDMRNMLGLSLSERRAELKECVRQSKLPFAQGMIRFEVVVTETRMTATNPKVHNMPDALRACIAAELGDYEVAAEEDSPFLENYSDFLDISLIINAPPPETEAQL